MCRFYQQHSKIEKRMETMDHKLDLLMAAINDSRNISVHTRTTFSHGIPRNPSGMQPRHPTPYTLNPAYGHKLAHGLSSALLLAQLEADSPWHMF